MLIVLKFNGIEVFLHHLIKKYFLFAKLSNDAKRNNISLDNRKAAAEIVFFTPHKKKKIQFINHLSYLDSKFVQL